MSPSPVQKPKPLLSKRHLGVASVAAIIGCVACCAFPLLVAAGLGSGAMATLSGIFRPGSELLVGRAAFLGVLGILAVRQRRTRPSACGPACEVDGTCRDSPQGFGNVRSAARIRPRIAVTGMG
jgi:hypothetical protein